MRKRFFAFALFSICSVMAADASFTSCGAGYVLAKASKKIDGLETHECQKLWCRDLETGRDMGDGERANAGYQMTHDMVDLCDATGRCVQCWGERKWCAGEPVGRWKPEFGAYGRDDNLTYRSYQKGSCFAWRLSKPECADGEVAILQDDKWICAVQTNADETTRGSTIRRTGVKRRLN